MNPLHNDAAVAATTKVAVVTGTSTAGVFVFGIPITDFGAIVAIGATIIATLVNLFFQFQSRNFKQAEEVRKQAEEVRKQNEENRRQAEHEARMQKLLSDNNRCEGEH